MNSKRLLTLRAILFEQTDKEHRLTAQELVSMLCERGINAEKKAVYRDIAALSESGVSIIKSGRGYYIDRDAPADQLAGAALFLLSQMCAIDARDMELLESRMSGGLSKRERDALDLTRESIPGMTRLGCIAQLLYAIKERRAVSSIYASRIEGGAMGGFGSIILNPYSLFCAFGKVYLCCKLSNEDELRHIDVSRMCSITVLAAAIPPNDPFCSLVEEYVANASHFYLGKGEYVDMKLCATRADSPLIPQNSRVERDGLGFICIKGGTGAQRK